MKDLILMQKSFKMPFFGILVAAFAFLIAHLRKSTQITLKSPHIIFGQEERCAYHIMRVQLAGCKKMLKFRISKDVASIPYGCIFIPLGDTLCFFRISKVVLTIVNIFSHPPNSTRILFLYISFLLRILTKHFF